MEKMQKCLKRGMGRMSTNVKKGKKGKKGGGSSSCYGRLYIELVKSGMKRS